MRAPARSSIKRTAAVVAVSVFGFTGCHEKCSTEPANREPSPQESKDKDTSRLGYYAFQSGLKAADNASKAKTSRDPNMPNGYTLSFSHELSKPACDPNAEEEVAVSMIKSTRLRPSTTYRVEISDNCRREYSYRLSLTGSDFDETGHAQDWQIDEYSGATRLDSRESMTLQQQGNDIETVGRTFLKQIAEASSQR